MKSERPDYRLRFCYYVLPYRNQRRGRSERPDYRLRFCYAYTSGRQVRMWSLSERPDYRLRFCYGKEFKAWAVDYFKVKGQITACGIC